MGMNWAEHTTEIEAPIETSFEAIVDYESFPGWQDAVDSVEVLSRTNDGLGENVRLFVDAKVRKIDYQLRYSYARPTEIKWDFVDGNGMRDVDGVYTLESLGPARTRATYNLGADPEIPVPGMVLRRTHKALVKRSVEDLKAEAERRHAAGPREAAAATPEAAALEAASEAAASETGTAAPGGAGEEWVPKAEREPPAPTPSGGSSSTPGSLAEVPGALAGRGISIAGSALRAGRGVADGALQAGREVAGRIDRLLSGDEQDKRDDRRR